MKNTEFISLSPYHRKEKILDVAAKIFAEKGYDAVTTLELAQGVGCSESTLLQIFHTKSKIYDALFEEWQQQVPKIAHLKIVDGSAFKTLQHYFNKQINGIPVSSREMRPHLEAALYSRLTGNSKEKMYSVLRHIPDFVQYTIQPIIEMGQQQGEFVDGNPGQLAFLYYSILWGLKYASNIFPQYNVLSFKDFEYIFKKQRN